MIVLAGIVCRDRTKILVGVKLVRNLPSEQCFQGVFQTEGADRFPKLVDHDEQMMVCPQESGQGMPERMIFPDVVDVRVHRRSGRH